MRTRDLKHRLPLFGILLAAGIAVAILVSTSHTSITRARLERSLPPTFAHLYVQQAKILGHKGITLASIQPKAQCDKGGPNVADEGPGNNWICLMTWHDPNIDKTVLPGKFELNVKSNDCYTAGGPSKIIGLATITDTKGNDVPNPVFEFDGCFDPRGTNRPTGVSIATTTSTTATTTTSTPAALTLPGRAVASSGRAALTLTCSGGDGGCAGSLVARAGSRSLGTASYAIAPGGSSTVTFALHAGERALDVTAKPVIGSAPTGTAHLPVSQ